MALISCPECGKEISDKATVCVNCGCPVVRNYDVIDEEQDDYINESESGISIASLILFVVGMVLRFISSSSASVFLIVGLVLMVVAFLQKDRKSTCASIVFWLFTGSLVITLLVAIMS